MQPSNKVLIRELCPPAARVILQDLTGVPAVVDFAAMRDAVKDLGGDPSSINPQCPCDLVIDHSVQVRFRVDRSGNLRGRGLTIFFPVLQVDFARSGEAISKNEELEFERNKERFVFLKWGATALDKVLIVPPGSGIVHQVV